MKVFNSFSFFMVARFLFPLLFLGILVVERVDGQSLIINEVSQGESGSKEYVELVVVDTPVCVNPSCVDLRGWIIDDNNGWHATGTGSGIADGCVRLTQDPFWSCVPAGTLILIYNDNDVNDDIPPDDLNDSNGDCAYVLPIGNSQLFENHSTQPAVGNNAYPTTGFNAGGVWWDVSMSNGDDSFHLVDGADLTQPVFSVSWGNNTTNNDIYFAGSAGGSVFYMANSVSNDPYDQNNWVDGNADPSSGPVEETPGSPNTSANAEWIHSMNPDCYTYAISSLDTTSPSCSASDGAITVNATGGVGSLEYSIDSGSTYQSGNVFSGLSPGSYDVLVRDSLGCIRDTVAQLVTLAGPTSVDLDLSPDTCLNGVGEVDITAVTGGASPYTYSFDSSAYSSQTVYGGVSADSFAIGIMDDNGCVFDTVVAVDSLPPVTDFSYDSLHETCGTSNGAIWVTGVLGGTSPYEYDIDGNGFGVTDSFGGLASGSHTVTIRDQYGCVSSKTISLVNLAGPTDISFSVVNATCGDSNGEIQINGVTGGASPYEYSFDGGAFSNQTIYSNLGAGTYTTIVRDTNGCTYSDDTTLTNSNAVTISGVSTSSITCNGDCDGTIDVNTSGGSTPIQYSIDDGTNFQASSNFSGLCDDTYDIVVEDSLGCTDSAQINLDQPAPIAFDTIITDLSCFQNNTGAIEFDSISGGNGNYQFSMDSGANYQVDSLFSGLSVGTYDLVIQDGNGCGDTLQATVQQPPELIINFFTVDSASCYGVCDGSVSAFPSGGTASGQYQFYWSNNIGDTAEAQPSGVCAGSYSLTVEDDNGCTVDTSFNVAEPAPIMAWSSTSNAYCELDNGSAFVDSVNGGYTPYSYSWGSGANNQSGDTAYALFPGNYQVTVTDSNGCDTTLSVTVGNDPGQQAFAVDSVNAVCFDSCNGQAEVDATGGFPPYSFQWSSSANGQTTALATGLCAGPHYSVIEDSLGCRDTVRFVIQEPQPVQVQVSPDTTICENGTASLEAIASGGDGPYDYLWSNGAGPGGSNSVSPADSNTYMVMVQDSNGCASDSASVNVDLLPPLDVTGLQDTSICPGDQVLLSSLPSGGNGNYSYSWNNLNNGQNIGNSGDVFVAPGNATSYEIVLSDDCESTPVSDTVMVDQLPTPQVDFSASGASGCEPVKATFFNNTSNSYSCIWEMGDGTVLNGCDSVSHFYEGSGQYDVKLTVVSLEGCADSLVQPAPVTVYPYPDVDFELHPDPVSVLEPTVEMVDLSNGVVERKWIINGMDTLSGDQNEYSFKEAGPGEYRVCLRGASSFGCVDTTCEELIVEPYFSIYVPNSFSPDGDGKNDGFYPVVRGIDEREYTFMIFDRWGEKIFESHNPSEKWYGEVNGESQAKPDVYIWKLKARSQNTKETVKKTGHVTLIR